MLLALCLICCSAPKQANKTAAVDNAKIEKNKQIAALNEVGETVRDAQSVEKYGRGMTSYRRAFDAESRRACNIVMENNQKDLANLETRIKNLPENYQEQLAPIIPALNECISCSKNAMDGCVKARADINKIIKQIYP